MKVRKDWTFKQAEAAQRRFQKTGGTLADPTGPLNQWVKLQAIDRYKQAFDGGDRGAILTAVTQCALAGLVMPDWLASAYLTAYRSVSQFKSKSWDDAFGQAHPKNAQLASLRKKRNKSVHVWNEVNRLHLMGEAIDDELFTAVGKKLGLGLTLTKEYYSEWKTRTGRKSSAPRLSKK